MSYLDDPRVFFAAERTLLAWQRTAIALIGLGFVIERFALFTRMLTGGAPLPDGHLSASLIFGVMFLMLGAAVSAVSAHQFTRFARTLAHPEIPRGHAVWFGPLINYVLSCAALGLSFWFVWTA